MFFCRVFRIETIFDLLRESEKIGLDQSAPLISGQGFTQGDQPFVVPFDYGGEVFDDHERAHARILKGGRCGVAQAESANHHVEVILFQGFEAELGQLTLGFME